MPKEKAPASSTTVRRDFVGPEPVLSNEPEWTTREPSSNWYESITASHPIPHGARLLDVGGGGGAYAALLEAHGADVVLLDQSRACLEAARVRGCRKVVQGSATALPFVRESFSLVVMRYVLHQIPPAWRLRALAECVRVLQDRGRLILESTDVAHIRNNDLELYSPLRRVVAFMYPALEQVKSMVKLCGLQIVSLEPVRELRPEYSSSSQAIERSRRLVVDGEGPTPWLLLNQAQRLAFHKARSLALEERYGDGPVPRQWSGYTVNAVKA
jgi:SAM-dependent methyltransferase